MRKLKAWRRGVVTAGLVGFVFVAAALAWNGSAQVSGSNSPGDPNFGLTCSGFMETNTWTEGYPYVESKCNGYGEYVGSNGSWISDYNKRAAASHAYVSLVPFGNYTGTARLFVNDTHVGDKSASHYFNDPPSDEPSPCDGCGDGGDSTEDGETSPIVIPTGQSQAIRLTSVADGVLFDLRATGAPVRTAWTVAGSEVAFLALDRNGNGVIDSGAELFGDATFAGVGNGFKALRLTDGHNNDGSIDPADPLFASLLLWTDRNHNGYSEADELRPVSDVLDAIGLGYTYAQRRDGSGNRYRYLGWARKISRAPAGVPRRGDLALDQAREIRIFDVFFRVGR